MWSLFWQVWNCTSSNNAGNDKDQVLLTYFRYNKYIYMFTFQTWIYTSKNLYMRSSLCFHFYIHLNRYDKDLLFGILQSSITLKQSAVHTLCRWCCRKHEADTLPVQSVWYSRLLNLYPELLINKLCNPD